MIQQVVLPQMSEDGCIYNFMPRIVSLCNPRADPCPENKKIIKKKSLAA